MTSHSDSNKNLGVFPQYNRGKNNGTHVAGLVRDVVKLKSERTNVPNFKAILPRQMAKLVADGLFVADASAEGGYRITELGKAHLKSLEGKS